MTKLDQLADLGQSVWLDFIRRSFIESGELQRWVDLGLRGVTSNPSIFDKAISGSDDYDPDIQPLAEEGRTVLEIYEALAIEDIRRAADILRPVYERTQGADGYVSLEANPHLAHDTQATIDEVRRLAERVDRPNVMFKVPATPEGVPAIEALTAEGINVNVTLIFSTGQYEPVAEAYISGLEQLVAAGGDPSQVASVASFFVSRVDTKVDNALEAVGTDEAEDLQGEIAIANAKVAYARFEEIFAGERWERLAEQGARLQRVLWGSTSTKNPDYSDVLYVENLIGPHTVNTLPPDTLEAFRDHGTVASTVQSGVEEARRLLAYLARTGIDLRTITETLQDEGVAAFARDFDSLLESIAGKRNRLLGIAETVELHLGTYQDLVDGALQELAEARVVERIWERDHTVWKPEPEEIGNRLGWLDAPREMREDVECLQGLLDDVQEAGYTQALLMGMGGSSLAPEVFSRIFGKLAPDESLALGVLDSTDPQAVLVQAESLTVPRALFIVASKSGTTAETRAFLRFFYDWLVQVMDVERAGEHFVAVTDPGSPLAELGEEHDFRAVFLNDPHIGGRYSALSYFGLVPATLAGVDVPRLLDRALGMARACKPSGPARENPGALLGTVLGELAAAGRDKATFVLSPSIAAFGDWLEQLIAESTGKEGTGILPVIGEPPGTPDVYGEDRLFIHLRLDGEEVYDRALAELEEAGHPVVRIDLRDPYDLGGQIFLWEFAIAVAGQRLGINPFNQPNVESAKRRAREMIESYHETGRLPQAEAVEPSAAALDQFLARGRPGDYVSILAYVTPSLEADAALLDLRTRVRDQYRLATTVGYGPRYLHSTGQLHKGDAGNGLFVLLTADHPRDVAIPDELGSTDSSMTFGVLEHAQALGDLKALQDAERRVVHFHLGEDVLGGLQALAKEGA